MFSCFPHICRIFFCCEDEEKEERRSSYGGYYSPLQRESSPKRSPYTPYTSSSLYSFPPAASTSLLSSSSFAASRFSSSGSKPSSSSPVSSSSSSSSSKSYSFSSPSPAKPQLKPSSSSLVSSKASSSSSSSSSLAPSLTASFTTPFLAKPQPPHAASTGAKALPQSESYSSSSLAKASSVSSPFLSPSLTVSFASPSPAKPQSPHTTSAGAKTSQLSKPSSSSLVSSKASSSSSSSYCITPLTASSAPPSPAKAQPPHATSAGAKASRLSEPYSSPSLVSSKASSSSSSSSTPPSTASFAPPSPVKAQSPRATSAGPKALLQWKPVSSKASSSSSSSFLAPSLTASFASPSPAKAQPPHATSAGAKASRLSEPYASPSLVSSKASSSSSSSSTPPSTASFAPPPPVKAQSPHATSAGPKALLQWKPVSSKASSSSSSSFLAPSLTASSASPSPVKTQSPHAALAEPSSPSSVSLSKASSSSSSSLAPSSPASFASPEFDQRNKIGQLPRYEIPKHLQEQIKNDVVPRVLRRPLSPSTYADHFAALLYAEDYYCEKWSDFILLGVTLELRKKDGFKIQNSTGAKKNNRSNAQKDKPLVAFEIDSVPENRPYLISRDHVLVQPAGKQIEPFQGIFFRVEKSKWVLAEFEDDFHKQHSPSKKYDVSFSFNRVCLKRSHHAVSAAMDPLLCSILFPDPPRITFLGPIHDFNFTQNDRQSAVIAILSHILNLQSPEPYLLEGPLSETPSGYLSDMGKLIHTAIIELYETCSNNRILVCAPRNRTLDALTKSLLEDIPESRIFRANAAFREYGHIPDDIMPTCSFEGECFTCPPLAELEDFRVVTSTFISTFRLKAAGIGADHFSHIFLVDASSSTEPETIVALANLVGKTTAVVATGSRLDRPQWVRSDMARRNGLKKSFFQRLLEMEPYCLDDPMCITHVYGDDKRNDGTMILPSIDTHWI